MGGLRNDTKRQSKVKTKLWNCIIIYLINYYVPLEKPRLLPRPATLLSRSLFTPNLPIPSLTSAANLLMSAARTPKRRWKQFSMIFARSPTAPMRVCAISAHTPSMHPMPDSRTLKCFTMRGCSTSRRMCRKYSGLSQPTASPSAAMEFAAELLLTLLRMKSNLYRRARKCTE